MEKLLTRYKIHYGWVIVMAGFIIMTAGWGIVFNTASLFIKPLSAEFGFSRSQVNFTMTLRSIFMMVVSLLSGRIFAKVNVKRLMQGSALILVITYYLFSKTNSLLMLYTLTAMGGICISLISTLPLSLIISNWFVKHRNLAIGIAFTGSGIGGMLFSSLTGGWIVTYGWRIAYQFQALAMLLMIVPTTLFLVQLHPESMGLLPYGANEVQLSQIQVEKTGMMMRKAMKTPRFWLLNLCGILLMLGLNPLMTTTAPHLTDIGYSIRYSANVVALTMGSLAVGKLVLGKMFDSWGLKKALTSACVALIIGLIGLIFAKYPPALIAVILGAGLGAAYGTIANTSITIDLYGMKDYSSIYGFLTAVGSFGGAVAPMLSGYIFDRYGSYQLSFLIGLVASVLAILIYQVILRDKRKTTTA
ncbi:MAG TPA: MFS transporter [Bacillota bacterium]|nr:MFS transporter [Bacillota bacterium]